MNSNLKIKTLVDLLKEQEALEEKEIQEKKLQDLKKINKPVIDKKNGLSSIPDFFGMMSIEQETIDKSNKDKKENEVEKNTKSNEVSELNYSSFEFTDNEFEFSNSKNEVSNKPNTDTFVDDSFSFINKQTIKIANKLTTDNTSEFVFSEEQKPKTLPVKKTRGPYKTKNYLARLALAQNKKTENELGEFEFTSATSNNSTSQNQIGLDTFEDEFQISSSKNVSSLQQEEFKEKNIKDIDGEFQFVSSDSKKRTYTKRKTKNDDSYKKSDASTNLHKTDSSDEFVFVNDDISFIDSNNKIQKEFESNDFEFSFNETNKKETSNYEVKDFSFTVDSSDNSIKSSKNSDLDSLEIEFNFDPIEFKKPFEIKKPSQDTIEFDLELTTTQTKPNSAPLFKDAKNDLSKNNRFDDEFDFSQIKSLTKTKLNKDFEFEIKEEKQKENKSLDLQVSLLSPFNNKEVKNEANELAFLNDQKHDSLQTINIDKAEIKSVNEFSFDEIEEKSFRQRKDKTANEYTEEINESFAKQKDEIIAYLDKVENSIISANEQKQEKTKESKRSSKTNSKKNDSENVYDSTYKIEDFLEDDFTHPSSIHSNLDLQDTISYQPQTAQFNEIFESKSDAINAIDWDKELELIKNRKGSTSHIYQLESLISNTQSQEEIKEEKTPINFLANLENIEIDLEKNHDQKLVSDYIKQVDPNPFVIDLNFISRVNGLNIDLDKTVFKSANVELGEIEEKKDNEILEAKVISKKSLQNEKLELQKQIKALKQDFEANKKELEEKVKPFLDKLDDLKNLVDKKQAINESQKEQILDEIQKSDDFYTHLQKVYESKNDNNFVKNRRISKKLIEFLEELKTEKQRLLKIKEHIKTKAIVEKIKI